MHQYQPSNYYSPSPSSTISAMSLTPPALKCGRDNIRLPEFPCMIHQALRVTPSPLIHYNVAYPVDPNNIQRHPSLPPHFLTEPATNPPLPYIKIIHQHIQWPININASGRHGHYVTVGDVLRGIYHSLRENVSALEYKQMPSQDAQMRVTDAYQRRYRRIADPEAYEREKAKGLKRVDFLLGRTTFAGLGQTEDGPDVWVLSVS